MKLFLNFGVKHALAVAVLAGLSCSAAHAQDPIVVGTTAVAVIQAIKPKKQSPFPKFEGTVMNSNSVLITVRSKENELAVRTFTLTEDASAKMQKLIDKGGYQYGDKVTVFYDPTTNQAIKVKGKASKPI
jgi:molybdopterin biosynthesis enzyme